MHIHITLWGIPSITYNDELVILPYRKAEALFYYLYLVKEASRDKLCELFWDEADGNTAKKNLRNAIYTIRKSFDKNILVSPSRNIVRLNQTVTITTDMDWIFKSDEIVDIPIKDLKGKEFLEGMSLKHAEGFQEWLITVQEYYRDSIITYLHRAIKSKSIENESDDIDSYCKTLIDLDEFNEFAYRALMISYRNKKKYLDCLKTYNILAEILQRELNIVPEKETRDLYNQIIKERLDSRNIKKPRKDKYFYGRSKEWALLKRNYELFINSGEGKSYAVIGEVGVGKTYLVNRLLMDIGQNQDVFILRTSCYRGEMNFLLKPWHRLFKDFYNIVDEEGIEIPQLLNKIITYAFPRFEDDNMNIYSKLIELADFLKYQVVEHGVFDVFEFLAKHRKIVIFIDDIQWMDQMSLNLLKNMIIQIHNKNIVFLMTCRNSKTHNIDEFISEMGMYGFVNRINLQRFNEKETNEFFRDAIDKLTIDYGNFQPIIYNETKGNALFLVNFINNLLEDKDVRNLSPVLKDILESRLIDVSDEAKKLLDVVAIFDDEARITYLKEILGVSEMAILDMVEELLQKNLLREVNSNEIAFKITHPKLRKYIVSKLSTSKQRILKRRVDALIYTGA